jgi:hypothetical protein
MADVEHSTLTGSSLHEPKGIDAAAVNTLYVADGVGGGSWDQVPIAALESTAKSFQAQLLHLQDQQTAGTGGGASSVGLQTRVLNTTVTNEISGASLAANTITLPAGTFYIEASSPGFNTFHQILLRNVTDSSNVMMGTSMFSNASAVTTSVLRGRFTIASAKTFQIWHYTNTATGSGLGVAVGASTEIYSDVRIWKTA